MSVDLSTNSKALKEAYDAVVSGANGTNWAVFGYQGKTNTVKLIGTGDGGLEEFVEEFNGSHIQYGYARITDDNHGTSKYIFVNWSGEGAPVERKGLCANHVKDVQKFFPSAHVTINGRSEADLDVDAIKKLVAKSSGAAYSNHKESGSKFASSPAGPIASTYQNSFKSEGTASTSDREKFWQTQEADEISRKKAHEAERAQQKAQLDAERIAREKESEAKRDLLMQQKLAAAKKVEPAAAAPVETRSVPKAAVVATKPRTPSPEPVAHTEEPSNEPEIIEQHHEEVHASGSGQTAIALYDYQAAEENELTFDPDEIITDIEQIDAGWWKGTCRGVTGIFPSNYVQLQ